MSLKLSVYPLFPPALLTHSCCPICPTSSSSAGSLCPILPFFLPGVLCLLCFTVHVCYQAVSVFTDRCSLSYGYANLSVSVAVSHQTNETFFFSKCHVKLWIYTSSPRARALYCFSLGDC
ncbi:hypothetical protein AMECASPLE_030701 [Ameca splendens]|uniref:Uncharacterized protein n=1 Tax=Ameca splendens TaxID=208324 RepID=A0ABV0ZG47_9TELE